MNRKLSESPLLTASPANADELKWIRPVSQKRSQQALESILDAAQKLINDRPFDEISVAEICEAAHCSLPGFYRRFRDKEALLHALHSRHIAAAIATAEEALAPGKWEGRSISEILSSSLDLIMSPNYQVNGLRATAAQRAAKDAFFAERNRAARAAVYVGVKRLLHLRRNEFRHPDPELAAKFLVKMIYGVMTRYFGGDATGENVHPLTDLETKDELVRTVLAYLDVVDEDAAEK